MPADARLALMLLAAAALVLRCQAAQQLQGSLVMVHDDDSSSPGDTSKTQSCTPTPIEVAMCKDMHYNLTAVQIPGFAKQAEVAYVLKHFEDLLRVPCAPFMKLFVCSMHLPLCNEAQSLLVRPCKEFCQRIQGLCTPMLQQFGHSWPQSLACDDLTNERDPGKSAGLCLRPSGREFEEELQRLRSSHSGIAPPPDARSPDTLFAQPPPLPPPPSPPLPPSGTSPRRRSCSAAEVRIGPDGGGSGRQCAHRCSADLLFSREDKTFASAWMLIWSAICLASTALAVATFALDSERFRFPERPIVWVAACYLVFSAGHVLRASLGPDVACGRSVEGGGGDGLHRVSRHAGHWCAVIFLLLYFSSLAGCLWWLLLTVCWYLCAARKWAHEALAHRTMWLHAFAWGCPLLLSVALLVLHRIEADELTHLCTVDASNRLNLLIFVIGPVAVSLLAGLCFFICALCSTISVRHSLKWGGNPSFRRLEKLMTKISLFSFLFVLPTVCVLAANVYEFLERDKWTASLEKVLSQPHCVNTTGLLPASSGDERCRLDFRPSAAFYMLKIFMSLAAGLPSGLVVWFNCKSLSAWQRCLCRGLPCRGRRDPQPPLPQPPLSSELPATRQYKMQQQQQQQHIGRLLDGRVKQPHRMVGASEL